MARRRRRSCDSLVDNERVPVRPGPGANSRVVRDRRGAGRGARAHAPRRLQFMAGAVARGKLLFAAILVVGFAGLGVYYATKTPLYRVSTTLLTQRQQAMPSIVRASVPNELPTKAAFELIQRRENLVSLLKQTNVYNPSSPAPKSDWMIRLELAAARLWSGSAPARGPAQRPRPPAQEGAHRRDGRRHRDHLGGLARRPAGLPARRGRPPELPRGPAAPGDHRHRRHHHPAAGAGVDAAPGARRGHRRSVPRVVAAPASDAPRRARRRPAAPRRSATAWRS